MEMFKTVEEIKNFQNNLRGLNESFTFYYLNTIYQNLLMREESPNEDINEFNNKNLFSTQKLKASEKGISFRNFLQYFDIQEFMCERIFNYLDKSKTNKLTKNEFVNGINTIFFGNINELYKMAFYMCDFNEKNKILKFNMKLLLSYIPVKTYEEQQEYIKYINSIFHNYFQNLDKKFPEKNIKETKEIDYDLYKNSIEEYINDKNQQNNNNFNNNGSFLLFISLISYIYQNYPFNTENMNYCNFIKNKFLMKVPQNKNNSSKSERNNSFKFTAPQNLLLKSFVNNSPNKGVNSRNNSNKSKDLSKKDNSNQRSNSLLHSKKSKFKKNNKEEKKLTNQLSDEELKIIKKKDNSDNKEEKMEKLNLFASVSNPNLPEVSKKALGENFRNNFNESKSKVGDFHLSPIKKKQKNNLFIYDSNQDNEDILIIEEGENNINTLDKDEYSDIVFKYCEEENSKFIKKYYASLRGKEILFFSSKLKNELCSIWSISKTIIIIKDKASIGKYTFYPIKFINYNGSFCLLFFEEQEKQKIFAKKCEEFTNFLKFEDFFEFKEKLGEGHFGLVKRCIEKSTGKEYAVKIMNKSKIKEKDLNFLIQERNYMSLIKHPNIVSLIQDFEDEQCIYFVMEYFKGGDLSKYLNKIKDDKEKNLEKISAKIIRIIAIGVQYLNHFGIVHRDLKPENIVFEKEEDIKSIKIIDLGVAITLPYGKQSSDPIGTLAYIAPEMYTQNPYSYKVDVWSIGILLYYLTSGGIVPFFDEKMDETIMGKKVVFTHQEYPEKYFGDKSRSLFNLIDKALEKNPEKRITIQKFLSDEWINKYSK